jgi:hypothetical protein
VNLAYKNKKYDIFEKDYDIIEIPSIGRTIKKLIPKPIKHPHFYNNVDELTINDFEWENNMNEQNEQPKMFSIAEVRELVAKAWEDGYTTSSGDSFHNKNTPYGKSDFFKEFYSKYNKG